MNFGQVHEGIVRIERQLRSRQRAALKEARTEARILLARFEIERNARGVRWAIAGGAALPQLWLWMPPANTPWQIQRHLLKSMPAKGQLSLGDRIACPIARVMTLKACLDRQAAHHRGNGRARKYFEWCGSGRCGPGREYSARAPRDYEPPYYYQPWNRDMPAQLRAAKRKGLVVLQETPDLDHPPGAGATPVASE